MKTLCRKSSLRGRTKWNYRFRDRCKNTVSLWLYRLCTCISFCFHITVPILMIIFPSKSLPIRFIQIHQHPIALSVTIHFSPSSRPCLSGTIPLHKLYIRRCLRKIYFPSHVLEVRHLHISNPLHKVLPTLWPSANSASSTSFSIRSHARRTKPIW